MSPLGKKSTAHIVSFSGIDGAGKSTQIEALQTYLKDIGFRVVTIRFWDDVARLKSIRESAGHTLFKGDKGVGAPHAPITRKDKNVQSWPMTCVRLVLYFVDAVSARNSVRNALQSGADFIIFDRYCYDEMANLNLRNGLLRRYVLLLLAIVPALGRSYLLDADPVQARERKPEYPLDFIYRNRAAYLEMCDLTGRMTIISPMSVDEVRQEILRYTIADLALSSHAGGGNGSGEATRHMETKKLDGSYTHPAS